MFGDPHSSSTRCRCSDIGIITSNVFECIIFPGKGDVQIIGLFQIIRLITVMCIIIIVLLTHSLSLQKHTTCDPLPSWSPDNRDVDYPSGSTSSLHLSESTREEVSRTHFVVSQILLMVLVYDHTVHSNYEASTIENLYSW